MKYPDLRRLTVCRSLLEDAVIRKLLCVQEQMPAEAEEGGQALFSAQGELTDLLVQKAERLYAFSFLFLLYCADWNSEHCAE